MIHNDNIIKNQKRHLYEIAFELIFGLFSIRDENCAKIEFKNGLK